jgi:hypothetical protein
MCRGFIDEYIAKNLSDQWELAFLLKSEITEAQSFNAYTLFSNFGLISSLLAITIFLGLWISGDESLNQNFSTMYPLFCAGFFCLCLNLSKAKSEYIIYKKNQLKEIKDLKKSALISLIYRTLDSINILKTLKMLIRLRKV